MVADEDPRPGTSQSGNDADDSDCSAVTAVPIRYEDAKPTAPGTTTVVPQPAELSNIVVVVRKRPQNEREKAAGGRDVIRVMDGRLVVLLDSTSSSSDFLRHGRTREKQYMFDHAFDEFCTQEDVYEHTTKPLIDAVASGYNASVFAYGSTGAGKTHTMMGTPSQPGIMILALEDLFSHVSSITDSVFKVTLSYLEVYNENLRDLLRPSTTNLSLREDPLRGIQVSGVSEIVANSAQEVMELLRLGNANRTTEPTAANQTSSRSHAVLQIVVEQRDRTPSTTETLRVGKLSLIDLAGSERAAITQNRGLRMIEGANINRSLLALGNCITALGSNSSFVPFRDSKLTRMLKDSLGGNTKTVMITNVSPCDQSFEDTHNALKYANRAKNIRTTARSNVVEVSHHVAKYTEIISDLRREISSLKCQMRVSSLMQQRRDTKSLTHQLELEHWLSARDMTTWAEARQKLQAIFDERKQVADSISAIKIRNLDAVRELRKARILNKLGEPVEKDVGALEHEITSGSQQVQRLKKRDNDLVQREKELRAQVGLAGVNASQTISQILDLEMDMHNVKVENLKLQHGRAESDKGHADWIESLQDQVRIRDRIIADQKAALRSQDIVLSRPESRLPDPVQDAARLAAPAPPSSSAPMPKADGEREPPPIIATPAKVPSAPASSSPSPVPPDPLPAPSIHPPLVSRPSMARPSKTGDTRAPIRERKPFRSVVMPSVTVSSRLQAIAGLGQGTAGAQRARRSLGEAGSTMLPAAEGPRRPAPKGFAAAITRRIRAAGGRRVEIKRTETPKLSRRASLAPSRSMSRRSLHLDEAPALPDAISTALQHTRSLRAKYVDSPTVSHDPGEMSC
ncbi:Kinesin-like protein [Plasmodiophora brassicae]